MPDDLWDNSKLFDRWKELAVYLLRDSEKAWLEGTNYARDQELLFFSSEEFRYWCNVAGANPDEVRASLLAGNPTIQNVFDFAGGTA